MKTDLALQHAKLAVERLVLQYREYVFLHDTVSRLMTDKLQIVAALSKKMGVRISDITAHDKDFPEILDHLRRIATIERDRDQVADEMTYASPVIWMMYKDIAYQETPQAIRNWAAFKDHCAPEGYICGKRYRFLEAYLKKHRGIELGTMFSDDTLLSTVSTDPRITDLSDDITCIESWQSNEYLRTDGCVNKWGTKAAKK